MVLRRVCAGLAFTALFLAAGCCHPWTHRSTTVPAVVGTAPCCPPGAAGGVPVAPNQIPPVPPPEATTIPPQPGVLGPGR
jgi:hypothetical protein